MFCSHKWKSHTKKSYEWNEKGDMINTVSNTIEVLICEECGKIKKIKY